MYLMNFIVFDRTYKKNELKILIKWIFKKYGAELAIEVSERLKNLGFRYSTSNCFSLGLEDIFIAKEKKKLDEVH